MREAVREEGEMGKQREREKGEQMRGLRDQIWKVDRIYVNIYVGGRV